MRVTSARRLYIGGTHDLHFYERATLVNQGCVESNMRIDAPDRANGHALRIGP